MRESAWPPSVRENIPLPIGLPAEFLESRFSLRCWKSLPIWKRSPEPDCRRTVEKSFRSFGFSTPPGLGHSERMPELAEVEFYRKRWDLSARGERVATVLTHDRKKLLRDIHPPTFRAALEGAVFEESWTQAKQMLFRFTKKGCKEDLWLGIHLGMSGDLSVAPRDYQPGKHDHLVILTDRTGASQNSSKGEAGHALVFNDPRMFGRILFHAGHEPPTWWTRIAPPILSRAFTATAVGDFLARRRRAPIKAVLLMQERFPGVGNWMADEILWRAKIHPARAAGALSSDEVRVLWRECRRVSRMALATIAGRGRSIPADLNVHIPWTWLFRHRWRRGGKDPITGTPLEHATIGGRTTCWSPVQQPKIPKSAAKVRIRPSKAS